MLSTNQPSGIQRRRAQHRRQISTPAAFEASTVRPLPANLPQRRLRNNMSLDLRGLNLENIQAQQTNQEDRTVSNTNLGQPSQHHMQVAQPHSQPQPGPQDTLLRSPVQLSMSSPQTPRRIINLPPSMPPLSPSKPPTEQQLKELHAHIQSVYGASGQVFINILPTPTATPQKPVHLASHEPLNMVPHASHFNNMANINLEPTSSAMTFDFENPDIDMGYESSSYYTSDALSPSPISSPHQKPMQSFLEGIEENHEMSFGQAPALFPASSASSTTGLPLSMAPFSQASMFNDLEVDASLEYTGIAPEEVQRYISEQDPTTQKWTCMYQDCGKLFGRRENIRSHVQTHLGDRQYRCNGCGKCFVRQHDLKRHAKIHSGNKPYKCPCGAGFARQDALTRHRQRGMCVGGFPDAVRRQAKRGRPRKNRPNDEDRMDKSARTRRALASAPSSSASSPAESDARSPSPFDGYDADHSQDLPQLLGESQSFNDGMSPSTHPFGFETASNAHVAHASFPPSHPYGPDLASMNNILRKLSQHSHTPPMSPADQRPMSSGSAAGSVSAGSAPVQPSPLKGSSTPSRSSVQSNPFTTPPTSPIEEAKDDLQDLFDTLPDNSYSQFDLEMKAMSDFTSLDSSSYDLLDFTV